MDSEWLYNMFGPKRINLPLPPMEQLDYSTRLEWITDELSCTNIEDEDRINELLDLLLDLRLEEHKEID